MERDHLLSVLPLKDPWCMRSIVHGANIMHEISCHILVDSAVLLANCPATMLERERENDSNGMGVSLAGSPNISLYPAYKSVRYNHNRVFIHIFSSVPIVARLQTRRQGTDSEFCVGWFTDRVVLECMGHVVFSKHSFTA